MAMDWCTVVGRSRQIRLGNNFMIIFRLVFSLLNDDAAQHSCGTRIVILNLNSHLCIQEVQWSRNLWVLLCVNIPYITSLLHYIIVRSSIVHEVLRYTGSELVSSTGSKVVSSTGSKVVSSTGSKVVSSTGSKVVK